jgi:hypothetical protein
MIEDGLVKVKWKKLNKCQALPQLSHFVLRYGRCGRFCEQEQKPPER